ncbi:hypothetical protein ERJ75_000970000 [Trypanosoma vivax]|uniref:Uncharacterized protein n=1 Tax=Trypanosoma vivax (strain Y486) TaxID=1055687 RepID=G0U6C5_TRYVY|nr:hypothetical protein TRVL_01350 [Trypanosoma vivax]KAH8611729.1 hypothetical protein ERJ75_000970000 [Trypanosoma vivax]CCC51429.1 conserved hypothetical protein [Trypanosoma vivax Y486]
MSSALTNRVAVPRCLRRDNFHAVELARMSHVHEQRIEPSAAAHGEACRKAAPTNSIGAKRYRGATLSHSLRRKAIMGNESSDTVDWKYSLRASLGQFMAPRVNFVRCLREARRHTHDVSVRDSDLVLEQLDTVKEPQPVAVDIVVPKETVDAAEQLVADTKVDPAERLDALERLRSIFLPICLLRQHKRRRLSSITGVVEQWKLRYPGRRREKVVAVGTFLSYLRSVSPSLLGFRRLKVRVIQIQRAYRRHLRYLDAHVELNLLKIRAYVEPDYWERVMENLQRAEDQHESNGEFTAANFDHVGPLPESLLRHELRGVYYCWLWKVRHRAFYEMMPRFLSIGNLRDVIQNVCYITGVMRGDTVLLSHVRQQPRMIVPYFGIFIPAISSA